MEAIHPQLFDLAMEAVWFPGCLRGPVSAPEFVVRIELVDECSGQCLVYLGESVFFSSSSYDDLFLGLRSRVHLLVAENSPHIFVHAGVIEFGGHVLVFPGQSFCGKSTLIREMVSRGCHYYSDEFAVFDCQDGTVFPFRRPISVRQGATGKVVFESPGTTHSEKARVRHVLFLIFDESASLNWQELSSAQAALLLFQNCVAARKFGGSALHLLVKALSGVRCWQGYRAGADLTADRILGLLSTGSLPV